MNLNGQPMLSTNDLPTICKAVIMRFRISIKQRLTPVAGLTILAILAAVGCAYFNTYYNALQYYENADKIRLENAGGNLPSSAIESYNKVIEKCTFVIQKYPDSKYRYPAQMLIGKARFFKKDYTTARTIFLELQQDGGVKYQREAEYWLALCKWKNDRAQPALDDLARLAATSEDRKEQSTIHLSMAEIYLELNANDQAFTHLEKAAELTSTDTERGQIYYRISQLAAEKKDYRRALEAYRQVIRYSLSKKQVEAAHLETVRIYRLTGDLKTAANQIKTMLLDEKFTGIYGQLELELVKLYQQQGEWDLALTRLSSITGTYPRTEVSASAYYFLGDYELFHRWNLEDALKYYDLVKRESRKSEYFPAAQIKVKEITNYQDTQNLIRTTRAAFQASLLDTTAKVADAPKAGRDFKKEISDALMTLAELEAFHLSNRDSSVVHLKIISDNYPGTPVHPRAVFVLSWLYEQLGQPEKTLELEQILLTDYPKSDYAGHIREKHGLEQEAASSANKLTRAEQIRLDDPVHSLSVYQQIVESDSSSESALLAAYFLAWQYDYELNSADSALKYYQWIARNYPQTDQAELALERDQFIEAILIPVVPDTVQDDSLQDQGP